MLETVISGRKTIEAFEVEHFFPSIGQRIMVLNARTVYRPANETQQILLAIEDITEQPAWPHPPVLPDHDNFRADLDSIGKIDDVLVGHPNAA